GREAVAVESFPAPGSGAMDLMAAVTYDPRTIQQNADEVLQDLEACMGISADPAAAAAPSLPPPPVAALDPAWRTAGGLLGGLSWAPADGANRSGGDGEGGGKVTADDSAGRWIPGAERGYSYGYGGGGGGGVQLAALLWVDERVGGVVLVHVYGPSLAVIHVPAVHPRFEPHGPDLGALLLSSLESALSCAGVRTIL
ncbi:hypothetical protein Vretifemale_18827, partial [Volvox reticuliferus]